MSKLLSIGLEEVETDGLELNDRKRPRSDSEKEVIMDVDASLRNITKTGGNVSQKETEISGMDFLATTDTDLATLARQASRPL